jgi:hypothetical protein
VNIFGYFLLSMRALKVIEDKVIYSSKKKMKYPSNTCIIEIVLITIFRYSVRSGIFGVEPDRRDTYAYGTY